MEAHQHVGTIAHHVRHSGDVVSFQQFDPKHYTMTKGGLSIDLHVREEKRDYPVLATAILSCHIRSNLDQFLAVEMIKRGHQEGRSAQW